MKGWVTLRAPCALLVYGYKDVPVRSCWRWGGNAGHGAGNYCFWRRPGWIFFQCTTPSVCSRLVIRRRRFNILRFSVLSLYTSKSKYIPRRYKSVSAAHKNTIHAMMLEYMYLLLGFYSVNNTIALDRSLLPVKIFYKNKNNHQNITVITAVCFYTSCPSDTANDWFVDGDFFVFEIKRRVPRSRICTYTVRGAQ